MPDQTSIHEPIPTSHFRPEKFSTAMSESNVPMLVNLALDLQITICTLLHPSDILALRRVCHRSVPTLSSKSLDY